MSNIVQITPSDNSPYAGLPPINVKLFEAKARKGLSFDEISKSIGRDEVWLAAAFYGQASQGEKAGRRCFAYPTCVKAKFSEDELKKVSELLDINPTETLAELGSHWWPNRGLGPVPPHDPVLYRLYEGVLVYGHAIKAIMHEKFGDGIMSMIDCKVTVDKKPDPKGDRVVLAFDGKFLPYAKW
ncbi:hypothetical protein AX15_006692 [Amanita polypyramis BW_CC]|nr:hypothetical protein AX15_006692 [Amanita polypyramis BW_CC]